MEQEEKAPSDQFKPALLKNHLENFLLQAERESGNNMKEDISNAAHSEIFFSFVELVENHFKEQKPVSFYLEKLYISAKILSRATRKLSGKTPKHILDERLLLEAKRLLIHHADAGKGIGYALGFTEPTNFIKFFRKHTGKTPAAFREYYYSQKGQ